jgi:exopolyphosphatase / guanosine-5'-triphosphate,3'-diphosphate pyrophosphatase
VPVPMKKTNPATEPGRAFPTLAFPFRCAAIDVGSNAVRLLAAEFSDHDLYKVLEEHRDPVRLGHGVFLTGKLLPPVMEKALGVFAQYRARMDALGITHYRAVATSAVRESENGQGFLVRVRAKSRLELESITGSEEARLVHRAIRSRLDLASGSWIVVDVGGGSVEVMLVDATGILWSESHTMGSVRLLEELAGGAEDPGRFLRLLTEYAGTLRIPSGLDSQRVTGYVATGGNVEALAGMALSPKGANGVSRLSLSEISGLIQKLSALSFRERVEKLGLREDRADVILPAAIVYERLARLAGVQEILVPYVGLKEGLLLDLAECLTLPRGHAVQERQVQQGALSLGRKYRFDEAHGLHVAKHALSLFDQLRPLHELGEADRRILHAAAILHDIGTFVSYTRHHKHAMYLISESSLQGFSPRENFLVANVARYHRRGAPKPQHEGFAALDREERERVTRLAAILRLADSLDRDHRQTVRRVHVGLQKGSLRLGLEGEGEMLLEGWALKKRADLFQRTFALSVKFSKHPVEER